MRRPSRLAGFLFIAAVLVVAACARTTHREPGVPPALLSDPAEAREFARKNLPPGVRAGEIIADHPQFPDGDVAEVYRAALDAIYLGADKTPPFIVLDELAEGHAVDCDKWPCPFVPDHKSKIDTLTIQDFRRATLTRRRIRRGFQYRLPLTFLAKETQESLPAAGEALLAGVSRGNGQSEQAFWVGFMAKYPGAWGITWLTQVGFNPRHTEAMLQVRHGCGTYCASMEMMLLRKSNDHWQVVERMPEASRPTDLGNQYLRYRGVNAPTPLAELRAARVADSIREMSLPRAIRGVVTNSTSGEAIALARVTLQTVDALNSPSLQVYTDSHGQYVLVNPPVGGVGIELHCPKYTRRPGDMLSVAGADIKPGTDTTIDFPVDVQLCDDPTASGLSPRPQALSAPPPPLMVAADIATAQSAKFPSPEEAAIYTEVLNGMLGQAPGQVILVANVTRSLCSVAACADRYRQRIRDVPEVILSSMENFLSVRDRRLFLRPDFTAQSDLISSYSTRSDVALIGDSAMRYLEKEARFSPAAYVAGQGADSRYWEKIHEAYPNARGLISLSAVGFSPRHRQALVEVTRADINGFEPSHIFVLNNVAGEWRIVTSF